MNLGLAARVVIAIVIGTLLFGGGPTPVRAAGADKSEVVLVLDFSASILKDKANRERFAAALERIADRVDETSSALTAGDTTVSLVQFAAKAAVYQDCADMKLLGDALAVAQFADCLRSVAGAYRKGLDPALESKIGIDTNYVAAMEQAATHLPSNAVRPALILFTDGKHDVAGVPVSQVPVALDRLFGTRSPFALLPVGMGLEAKDRTALEAGLARMKIVRQMPACVSGATFDWPQVVFESADAAGNAVAVALQDATCTFTVGGPIDARPEHRRRRSPRCVASSSPRATAPSTWSGRRRWPRPSLRRSSTTRSAAVRATATGSNRKKASRSRGRPSWKG